MNKNFSLVTNVSLLDKYRIEKILPTWSLSFDKRCTEFLVIVDTELPTGRILEAQKEQYKLETIKSSLDKLLEVDHRFKIKNLDYNKVDQLSLKWFNKKGINRNQSGTPIFAFIYAVENSSQNLVLKTDSDMLYYDNGWIDESIRMLINKETETVSPPRINFRSNKICGASLFINKEFFSARLPIKPIKLSIPRRIHRFIKKREPWLAFSEILEINCKRKKFSHIVIGEEFGYSFHTGLNKFLVDPRFELIKQKALSGEISPKQKNTGWTLELDAWD